MKIDSTNFLVREGTTVCLDEWPTKVKPICKSKKEYHHLLKRQVKELSDLQRLHYASDRYALLLIFQAMDAAGKDGAIRHVLSGVNPQGCQVTSFKQPSDEELDHDFLWRTTKHLPPRGHIGVFNRSYYEEVLVVRVHRGILDGQRLPHELVHDDIWQQRFESICDLEKHLARNGTKVVKFYLHLSKEEQSKRFLARIDHPEKNWKFSESDIKEREHWDEYRHAYEEAISATSTAASPWYIVPADDKKNARLIIAQTLKDTLKSLSMSYPAQTPERLAELQEIRKELA